VTSAKPEPRTPEDEAIVQTLQLDLDAGFIELFQAYQHVVFSTALRITGRWADAEDLAAEAFLRAYRALSTFQRGRLLILQPRSWLLTITLNLWRNQQRTAARQPAADPIDEANEPPDPREDVERTCHERETDRELSILLTALPPDQRAAVVLRHVIGLSPTQVAGVLGRPEGTVRSDISRGLRRLRQLCPDPLLVAQEVGR
jgi:RNA polymerase sigma-70 factor (ECF subfamily)